MKWLLTILALLYVFNPFDLLPDIVVGAGWLDDLIVLGLLGYYFYRIDFRGVSSGDRTDRQPNDRQGQTGAPADDDGADNPHRVLGVAPGASQDDIRRAYRRLAAQYHPDKVAHLGADLRQLAEQKFKAIQAAYEMLKRP
ncbi:MAG: DnaJ domain-containing protein [Desulfobacterales bacterium]|nr:DnaJ domain-containing protein [Desulfobacterales bacterium]